MTNTEALGVLKMPQLIRKMAVPAAVGFLVMNIYFIADSIFIGKFVGSMGIAAVSVVMPITFLISAIGMAIGVGGSSLISRFLGADNEVEANKVFGNMTSLTIVLSILIMLIGYSFIDEILVLFGAKGAIFEPAKAYFSSLIIGIPFLAWSMMSNNAMRAEGAPKKAMMIMIISALVNLVLDPIFIIGFGWGMEGAAYATVLGYLSSTLYSVMFFAKGNSTLKLNRNYFKIKLKYIKSIFTIGSVTLARQGTVSLLSIVLNHSLFSYGSEIAVAAYGIISRLIMFTNFPVLGITQGFLPIAGFNFGAKKYDRVISSIKLSVVYGSLIAGSIFIFILMFPLELTQIFVGKSDVEILEMTPKAMIIVFAATPLITAQLIGSAYFQAIGKALPALFLTLTKQGMFLIPFILILPTRYELNGIWMAFPISDVLATLVTLFFLRNAIRKLKNTDKKLQAEPISK
ncbi:MAG: MATE family efflux transporter [Saprospiraceae bacterium]|nr:MATE family efflux transporter [Saprospiraceae bacterium]